MDWNSYFVDDDIKHYKIDKDTDSILKISLSDTLDNNKSDKVEIRIYDTIVDERWIYTYYSKAFNKDKEIELHLSMYCNATIIYYRNNKNCKEEECNFNIIIDEDVYNNESNNDLKVNRVNISSLDPVYVTPTDGYITFSFDDYYIFVPEGYKVKFLKSKDNHYSISFGLIKTIEIYESTLEFNRQYFHHYKDRKVDFINIDYVNQFIDSINNIDKLLKEDHPNIEFKSIGITYIDSSKYGELK